MTYGAISSIFPSAPRPVCCSVMVPYGYTCTSASFRIASSSGCRFARLDGAGFRFGIAQTAV